MAPRIPVLIMIANRLLFVHSPITLHPPKAHLGDRHPFFPKLARSSYTPLLSFRIPYFANRRKSSSTLDVLLEAGSGSRDVATRPPRARLAIELIERVADFLFELSPPTPDQPGDVPLCCAKPSWVNVKGFMQASIELHRMGFIRWLRVITIRTSGDWDVIHSHLHHIREIKCLDRTLLDSDHQTILSHIPFLYSASIDAHSDVYHDKNYRFAYRDIIPALPPSLKRLEVTSAHGPDIKVIATVKKHCPQLEVLRLGRCTMFNRIPACDFWKAFPHDHDAYISDSGTNTYADSLGSELSLLKSLHSLRMGLYLVPSNTVLAHRLYHRRGRDAPHTIDWRTAIPLSELPNNPFIEERYPADPATTDDLVSILHQLDTEPGEPFYCPKCVETTAETTQRTEESASVILHKYVPSLARMEWMGWLTPGHLGVHTLQLPLSCE